MHWVFTRRLLTIQWSKGQNKKLPSQLPGNLETGKTATAVRNYLNHWFNLTQYIVLCKLTVISHSIKKEKQVKQITFVILLQWNVLLRNPGSSVAFKRIPLAVHRPRTCSFHAEADRTTICLFLSSLKQLIAYLLANTSRGVKMTTIPFEMLWRRSKKLS